LRRTNIAHRQAKMLIEIKFEIDASQKNHRMAAALILINCNAESADRCAMRNGIIVRNSK